MNFLPPDNDAKRSSILGRGKVSSPVDRDLVIPAYPNGAVTLRHRDYQRSPFRKLDRLNDSGLLRLSNSFSTLGCRAYGTVLALQNLGGTLESMCTLAVVPVTSPSSSRKAVSCRDSTDCRLSECTRCSAFQSSWISASQSWPSKLGPEPGTMSRLRLACCVPNVTATFTLPRTSSASPVYVQSLTSLGWRGGAVSAVHSVRYVLSLMSDAIAPVSTSMLSGASLSWTVTSISDDLRPVVWKSVCTGSSSLSPSSMWCVALAGFPERRPSAVVVGLCPCCGKP